MSFRAAIVPRVLLAVWVAAASGCIYIPAFDRPTWEGRAIGVGKIEPPGRLVSMQRAEVLLLLGEPDWTAKDGSVFVYCWRVLEGVVIVASYGGGGEAEITSSQFVLVEFDPDGRVARAERASAKPFQTTSQAVEEWIASTGVPK